MKPLTLEMLAANAFRTLGLSGSAGQGAIEAAARRMRIWPDPARIPPTPWDLPALGSLSRTRRDIDHAVALLNEPASRAQQRLMWYHGAAPPHDPRQPLADNARTIESDSPAEAVHNAAIATLHHAFVADLAIADVPLWQRLVRQTHELGARPAYMEWLAEVESKGGFDKSVEPAELAHAVEDLAGGIAAALVVRTQNALADTKFQTFRGAVSALQSSGNSEAESGYVAELMSRAEDVLVPKCQALDAELRGQLRTNHDDPAPFYARNLGPTEVAATAYDNQIRPALVELRKLAADDTDHLVRIRTAAADFLALIALGWEWSGRLTDSLNAYREAAVLASGLESEPALQKDVERVAAKLEAQVKRAFELSAASENLKAMDPAATRQPQPEINAATATATVAAPRKRRKWPAVLAVVVLAHSIWVAVETYDAVAPNRPARRAFREPPAPKPPAQPLPQDNIIAHFDITPSTQPVTTRPAESFGEVNREP